MARGDVVRVDLPTPAGRPGREQFGERPAVVVQVDENTANLGTVLVVPLTSNQGAIRFAGSFIIASTPSNGLDVDSVALAAQLRAVDRQRIRRVVGVLSQPVLSELEDRLRGILGL